MTIIEAISDAKLVRRVVRRLDVGPLEDISRGTVRVAIGPKRDDHVPTAYRALHGPGGDLPRSVGYCWSKSREKSDRGACRRFSSMLLRDYSAFLKPGEVGTVMVIAADRRQARTILRYIRGFFGLPILKPLVVNETQESIELSTRIVIEVATCSFRSVRGYTLVAVLADEVAFWRSEESANPDSEILAAVRPGLATIPGSLLLCISSPYARRGMLWQMYERHFGKDDSRVLIWQANTKSMNPSLPNSVIDAAYEEDEAAAEYGAEFRRDVESFVSREILDSCIVNGRFEVGARPRVTYIGFVDPSGGSADSMTMAIAHAEKDGRIILDATRERKPPFSPDACAEEFCELLKLYGVSKVIGDRYGGQWPRERFRAHGAQYEPSERSKSEIYASLLPLLNSQRVELLDDRRLRTQLLGLERRTSRSGRDSIDHATGSHDDLVNSVAGAIVMAAARQITRTPVPIVRSTPILTYQSWVEEEFAEFARSLREKRNRR